MFYLHRKLSAVYAVFRARRSIILAPVKLHLLSFKASWQSGTSYKVVILQENSHWRGKRRRRNGIKQRHRIKYSRRTAAKGALLFRGMMQEARVEASGHISFFVFIYSNIYSRHTHHPAPPPPSVPSQHLDFSFFPLNSFKMEYVIQG